MAKDLASYHGLISNIFKQPKTKKEWDVYRLSNDQVQQFHELGYVSGIQILNESQINILRKELEEIRDPDHPGHDLFYEFHSNESLDNDAILFHSLGQWRITTGFHDALWNPAFVMAAHQLLENKPVRFWHDQLFCKPAKHGGVVAWHQDYSYWTRTVAMQHLTCWIGLDDATSENGCLQYIPKSHKWGLLDAPEIAGDMNGLMQFLSEDQKKEFNPVSIELKAGQGSFHNPLMVHGSFENSSNFRRRALVLNAFADGTISNSNDTLLKGVPKVSKGSKLEGKFFPLLYQE